MSATYDTIGVNYADLRQPDPRIAAVIHDALGDAETVLNVGAGAGSYEPADRNVTALEPSAKMIQQRPASSATVIQGTAEDLPFDDESFDAAMAVLIIHHWTDQAKGLAEMRRVTRGPVVLLTFDPDHRNFWLLDYIPQLTALDDDNMPKMTAYEVSLGPVEISCVPVPHDCTDGFMAAYWRRPRAYLDERVRAAISPFWMIGDITRELGQLERDLDSGAREQSYGALFNADTFDAGYRLVRTV
ncbi:MAG: class I SAM-dependent methyltransferase [Rhodospirillales bacterium]|nr:class I SAM-dependent methyltransferase [Rhodospirillales bacterium]MBO6785299.1 class I SAM-dependent methyltransferase [Rhodospirillales bacterium]